VTPLPIYHASGGLLRRKGRPDLVVASGRPSGSGYVRYEDLYVSGDSLRSVLPKVPAGSVLTLPDGAFEFPNFNDQGTSYGLLIPANCAGIWGNGRTTVLQMTPGSSTVAGSVPTAGGTTNPYRLIGIKNSNTILKNLQVQGTAQGHLYGGVNVTGSSTNPVANVTIDTVFFNGAGPGSDSSPPGETFQLGTNHTDNVRLLNCEFDGRDSGGGYCSSNIGWNNSTNAYVENTYTHHAWFGHGITFWQTAGIHTVGLNSQKHGQGGHGGHGINHENVSGVVLHENPTLIIDRANNGGRGFHITLQQSSGQGYSDNPNVSLTGITHDAGPTVPCFSVLIGDTYDGSQQVQVSMPTVTKAGVTLTARDANVSTSNPLAASQFFRYH